ncbi:MAG: DUF2312 domain-containing protein [Sphingobium sp.]|nr:DUF2312 domain-containing protein [Sphingobium sp.]
MGGTRNELRPAPPEKPKGRKKRPTPDPIRADPSAAAQEIRQVIERIERLEEEKAGIADDISDVYAEAKCNGYDVKTLRSIVRLRKVEKHVRQEDEALLETYKNSLGIE